MHLSFRCLNDKPYNKLNFRCLKDKPYNKLSFQCLDIKPYNKLGHLHFRAELNRIYIHLPLQLQLFGCLGN